MPDTTSLLSKEMRDFVADPLGFVRSVYPWGEAGALVDNSGPRAWQEMRLTEIGNHFSNPATRFQPLQVAISSGHGIGKSALIAWILHWGLSTSEDCRAVVTANTAGQLDTKTWPEAAKWIRMSSNAQQFDLKATSISMREKGHERLWRADAIPWSDNNTEAFAGLHNKGKRILVIYDEASAISDRIWEVTEGALTDENTEILWLAFGNPTLNNGRFRECFGRYKHRWRTHQIDSRQVEGTNKDQISKWVEDYGDDSDFVRVRVRGEFPRAGSSQFIRGDVVGSCRRYKSEGHEKLPKILSVDVARFGDDQTVIGMRQGRRYTILATYRGLGVDQVAFRVMEQIEEHGPDMTVVDGGGVGGGVVDVMRSHGYDQRLHEYNSGHSPDDATKYLNKRAETWGMMREWLNAGAEIPDDPELETDLTGPSYFFTAKNQIQLESKEDMKSRGLASPDKGDNLAMTFAVKVVPRAPRAEDVYGGGYSGGQGWMR